MLPLKNRLLNVSLILSVVYVLYRAVSDAAKFNLSLEAFGLSLVIFSLPLLLMIMLGLMLINYVAGEGVRIWHTPHSVKKRRQAIIDSKNFSEDSVDGLGKGIERFQDDMRYTVDQVEAELKKRETMKTNKKHWDSL
ncbi:hypothetical protein ACPV5U_08390 [Vibrio mediterranei]